MSKPQKMNETDPIEEELGKAGETSSVSPLVVKLDKYRIMSDTKVSPEEFLLRLFGKPCFPRRDLSGITGTEKCGKTFFTSMLMACAAAQEKVLELERVAENPLKILWYDTEQSLASTKNIMTERIYKLAKGDPRELDCQFYVFNVRACTYQERMDYLVAAIETYKPDMVILDNVCDLIPNINEAGDCIKLIDQLMQLATDNNCNISVVIHLNRSGEKRGLRGWLGTEILHKAFEVYYCEQIENTNVLSVEQSLTRKYKIEEKLYYTINDEGLPEITTKPAGYQPRNSNGQYMTNKPEPYQIKSEKVDTFNQDYIIRNEANAKLPWEWNLLKLFNNAMDDRAEMGLDALQDIVMNLSGIRQAKYYDKVFKLAVERRIIQTTMDRYGRVVVIPVTS